MLRKAWSSLSDRTWVWIALLLLVTLIWGNTAIAIKVLVDFVTPAQAITARMVPVALFFALLLLPTRAREVWRLLREESWRLLVLALNGAVLNTFFIGWGMTRTAAGTASLVIALNPISTFVLSAIFLKERFEWKRALGIAVAFGGLYIIVRWGSGRDISVEDVGYTLLTMLGPLIWSSFTVLGKSVLERHPPLLVIGVSMTLAGLISLAFVSRPLLAELPSLPASFWQATLFLALPCTAFAFVIWFAALERMPAGRVAAFMYLTPMWGVAFSHWLLDEPVTGALLVGAAVLLAGVWLVNRRGPVPARSYGPR